MAATDLTSTTSASAAASSAGIGASSLDDCPVTVTAASTPNNVVITFPHVVVPGVPRATILHVKVAHVEDMVAACWSFANLLGSQEVKVETIDPNTATPLVSNSYYVIDKGQPPHVTIPVVHPSKTLVVWYNVAGFGGPTSPGAMEVARISTKGDRSMVGRRIYKAFAREPPSAEEESGLTWRGWSMATKLSPPSAEQAYQALQDLYFTPRESDPRQPTVVELEARVRELEADIVAKSRAQMEAISLATKLDADVDCMGIMLRAAQHHAPAASALSGAAHEPAAADATPP